eukprot:1321499-Amphidinium_carterae.1
MLLQEQLTTDYTNSNSVCSGSTIPTLASARQLDIFETITIYGTAADNGDIVMNNGYIGTAASIGTSVRDHHNDGATTTALPLPPQLPQSAP